ncbi:hypothetical protein ACIA8O_37295 [Kitasatospora sp. NPDC051853]|uniref:hypothetical protein n=1 Tax=Kitasatospora sp. NPDC051853 TaxID=3364058 RepID=UPI00379810D4
MRGTKKTDHRAEAEQLTSDAQGRTGSDSLTDAVGEGLAAIAHTLLGSLASQRGPQVWLEVSTGQTNVSTMQIRTDRIVGTRVRAKADEQQQFVLEVLVPEVSEPGPWLAVAEGTGEWFELNASERLLNLIQEVTRDDEDPNAPVSVIRVFGQAKDKNELDFEHF